MIFPAAMNYSWLQAGRMRKNIFAQFFRSRWKDNELKYFLSASDENNFTTVEKWNVRCEKTIVMSVKLIKQYNGDPAACYHWMM